MASQEEERSRDEVSISNKVTARLGLALRVAQDRKEELHRVSSYRGKAGEEKGNESVGDQCGREWETSRQGPLCGFCYYIKVGIQSSEFHYDVAMHMCVHVCV